MPPDLLTRYFEKVNGRYVFDKDLRRAVIFGRNDLVKDAPISRVELLVCRNTLIYLNAETQQNILSRLHFALAPQGTLFLGHAEMLLSHGDRFTPLNLKHRIFRKAVGSCGARTATIRRRDLRPPHGAAGPDHGARPGFSRQPGRPDRGDRRGHRRDDQPAGGDHFGLSARDIGRLLRDLEVSYRPVELRTYLEQAKVERRSARIQDVKWQRPGAETVWLEIHVNPLVDAENGLLGVSVVFFDVTATRALLDKVVQTNHELEAAYEELQSTNEELETTNEELQSTVEELETTNEELQSTNEELETMNEELQCTNDELHSMNDMLRERTLELDDARYFLDSLINSVQMGMVVVDREMKVILWNRGCEELWGLRSDEATGTKLTTLDIGLPLDTVRPLIGNAFVDGDSSGETVVDAVNRRGRPARVRVMCTSFRSSGGTVGGALLLMEVIGQAPA